MTLPAGSAFGRYVLGELLGAGAMGEVYRARDEALGRDVAVKVLPAQFGADPDRLRRFEVEARAAGALNHPNVVLTFDLGTHENMPYVVSELLEGETLRAALDRGDLPRRRAVDFGVQIARGLAAAHAQGIVHRDLKPENLFVTRDGRVKILDFGLAKLVRPELAGQGTSDSLSPTMTRAGMIMGTAGYMAPEQVRGDAADHRSDLFSLGCVLFEMLAGRRAFERDTPVETLSAILKEDPARLPAEVRLEAPGISRLVLRCLEKRPDDRFGSARDLAFALEAAAEAGHAPAAEAAAASPAAALVGSEITFTRLTFQRGNILHARFTPDGHSVVFGGAWEGRPVEVFWMHLGSPEARSIGAPGSDVFGVSRTGELAVCLKRRFKTGFSWSGTLGRMPLGGLVARPMLEDVEEADWGPDGQIAIVREVGGMGRLEYPVGRVLFETPGWIGHLRVSRDGRHVAFVHHEALASDGGSVTVVDLEGRARVLAPGWGTVRGLSWSADGGSVWFTAHREGAGRNLHAVSLAGELRTLLAVPGQLCIQDVHPDGRAILTHSMERQAVIVKSPDEAHERDLSWLDWSLLRDVTPDGRMILILESGEGGGPSSSTWIRPTDGSPALLVGEGAGQQISPDGRRVLALQSARPGEPLERLMLLPTGVGEPVAVPTAGLRVRTARWQPDGRGVVVVASEGDRPMRLYALGLDGSAPVPIGPEGPVSPIFYVSPDGAWVAARAGNDPYALHPLGGGESRPIPGLERRETVLPWTLDPGSLLVQLVRDVPTRIDRIDLATGERTLWREMVPPDATGSMGMRGFTFARDADAYGYTYTVQLDDLYLLEGMS